MSNLNAKIFKDFYLWEINIIIQYAKNQWVINNDILHKLKIGHTFESVQKIYNWAAKSEDNKNLIKLIENITALSTVN